jgi:hypothetical protein
VPWVCLDRRQERRWLSPQFDAAEAVGWGILASGAIRPTGGMPLASPPSHVSHGGLSMPASGLLSITLSAISLSSGTTQSTTGH